MYNGKAVWTLDIGQVDYLATFIFWVIFERNIYQLVLPS